MERTRTKTVLLDTDIRKNGFQYTQLHRGKRSCVYAQHVTPDIDYFEVFLIKVVEAGEVYGKHYPKRELFPGNEDFGFTAWSYASLEAALKKFEILESKVMEGCAI